MTNFVPIEVEIHRETELAYGVIALEDGIPINDEADLIWLPKSQINGGNQYGEGEVVEIGIPEWLANEHNLI